jgi:hypothetical protein
MKVKNILVVKVHTVQDPVNMNDYNKSYFCVTILLYFHETVGNCNTQAKIVNMKSVVLMGHVKEYKDALIL